MLKKETIYKNYIKKRKKKGKKYLRKREYFQTLK
jgi:hypothetical protein